MANQVERTTYRHLVASMERGLLGGQARTCLQRQLQSVEVQ